MKIIKKPFLVLIALMVALMFSLYGCADKPGPLEDVESIEVIDMQDTLKPGDYTITAKCLPKNSDQSFTAKLKGAPRGVSVDDRGGKFVLSIGASAVDKSKVTITVTSSYDLKIKGTKEFTLSIPKPTFTMIKTEADLRAIADNMSGLYKLSNDITLTKDWVQLGDASHEPDNAAVILAQNPFKGILDGNGYAIRGIQASNTTAYDCGFFGQIGGAGAVRNIGFVGKGVAQFDMNFGGWSGVVAAQNFGTISNVYTDVKMHVAGGVAAAMVVTNGGYIENCYAIGATSTESTNNDVAGFIGVPSSGVITGCYADAASTGLKAFAGFRQDFDNEVWNETYLLSTATMQIAQTFKDAEWDEFVWSLVDGKYPELRHSKV